jgi:hypothetical protein
MISFRVEYQRLFDFDVKTTCENIALDHLFLFASDYLVCHLCIFDIRSLSALGLLRDLLDYVVRRTDAEPHFIRAPRVAEGESFPATLNDAAANPNATSNADGIQDDGEHEARGTNSHQGTHQSNHQGEAVDSDDDGAAFWAAVSQRPLQCAVLAVAAQVCMVRDG